MQNDLNQRLELQGQVKNLYKQARRQVKAGNYDNAEQLLVNALQINNQDTFCLRELALVYQKTKNVDKEEKVLKRALIVSKLNKNDDTDTRKEKVKNLAYTHGRIAKLYIDKGEYELADHHTDLKMELNKGQKDDLIKTENDYIAINYKIDICRAMSRRGEMLEWTKKLNKLERDISDLSADTKLSKKLKAQISDISNARIALEILDAHECLNICNGILEKNSKNQLALNYKARAQLALGEYSEADRTTSKRYLSLFQIKDPELKKNRQISVYLGRAQAKFGAGNIEEAKHWLNEVLELDPKNAATIGLLTSMHIEKGDLVDANAFVKQMEGAGDVVHALKHRGMIQLKTGKIKEGSENLYKFLNKVPDILLLRYMRTLAGMEVIDRNEFNDFIKHNVELGRITSKLLDSLTADLYYQKDDVLKMRTTQVANLSEPSKARCEAMKWADAITTTASVSFRPAR